MPHYKDGTPAQTGDIVAIEFEVTNVMQGETACNISLKAIGGPEDEKYAPLLVCNTGFCTKVAEGVTAE